MRVLFVCTANTCRSPMLEYMFKAYLKMKGDSDIEVDSAAMIVTNETINPMCLKTLDRHGVPYFDKMSKVCSKQVYSKSTFVFTMNDNQAEILRDVYGKKKGLISLCDILGGEVADPYGMGEDAYEKVYQLFWHNLKKIYNIVKK